MLPAICPCKLQLVPFTLTAANAYVNHINQSINIKFVGRRYTTRPGAPTVVSDKHDQKVRSWVVFWKY